MPSCNNCTRTKRLCLGYQLRVHWPDHPDGRRKSGQTLARVPTVATHQQQQYGRYFLNFAFDDVNMAMRSQGARVQYGAQPAPSKSLTVCPLSPDSAGMLLSYCK